MQKSLTEYLQYLQEAHAKSEPVSLAEFRSFVEFFAIKSARDGNDYALFEVGEKYFTATLTNNGFLDRGIEYVANGQGDVIEVTEHDSRHIALESIVQIIIYDNDLTGVYGSNVPSPGTFEPSEYYKSLYPVAQWVEEVERGDTVLGYSEWVLHMVEFNQA